MSHYIPRIADDLLERSIRVMGAVAIDGPRSSGKTATASRRAASVVRLDVDENARLLAETQPGLLLEGDKPRLIDEWQEFPRLWDHVRRAVDDSGGQPGEFLLTGSATPPLTSHSHTGAGRIARVRMRTMSSFESGLSSGVVSLQALFDGHQSGCPATDTDIRDYAEAIVRGGWPAMVNRPVDDALVYVQSYARNMLEAEIPGLQGDVRNPAALERFLISYAQLTAHPVTLTRILDRAFGSTADVRPVTAVTADRYRTSAERLMLIEDLPAWSPALRSRTRLVRTPKRFLCDPSLSAAFIGADVNGLLSDLNTMGFLYESLALRDLRVYADALGGNTWHYRETSGDLEADIVVSRPSGDWIAFEVKMGASRIDEAAANLVRLRDTRTADAPAALVIVTLSGASYRRTDGVWVVPLAHLGP